MQFNYGKIEQWFEGRIFMIRLIGAIGEDESRLAITRTMALVTQEIAQQSWGVCIDLREYQGHTPEAENDSDSIRQWCLDHHQCCEAYVYGNNAFRKSMIEHFLQSQTVHIPYQFFATIEEAKGWLQHQLK